MAVTGFYFAIFSSVKIHAVRLTTKMLWVNTQSVMTSMEDIYLIIMTRQQARGEVKTDNMGIITILFLDTGGVHFTEPYLLPPSS